MKYSLYLSIFFKMLKNPPPIGVIMNFLKFQIAKIQKKVVLNFTPVSVVISATKRCNFTCEFCFVEDYMEKSEGVSGDLSPAEFAKMLDSSYLKNALRVGFLGGEPFFNKNIFNYIKMLNKLGKITTVVTNSSLLKGAMLEELLKSPLSSIGLSLYDNNFDDVSRVAQALNGKKSYWIQTIINAKTLHKLEEVIKFAISNGAQHLIFDNYFPMDHERKDLVIYSDNEEYKTLKRNLIKKYKNKVAITWVPLIVRKSEEIKSKKCQLPFSYIQLDNEGNLSPCCVRPPHKGYGNIYDEVGWNSANVISLRKNMLNLNKRPNRTCENCQCLVADLYDV